MVTRREEIPVERHPYHGLHLYEVTGDELDQLQQEAFSVGEDFSFALVGITLAVSFLIALLTTDIKAERIFTVFVVITSLGFLSASFFGIRWFNGRKTYKRTIRRIRERVGPLGDESKQIGPRELAALPEQEAPPAERAR